MRESIILCDNISANNRCFRYASPCRWRTSPTCWRWYPHHSHLITHTHAHQFIIAFITTFTTHYFFSFPLQAQKSHLFFINPFHKTDQNTAVQQEPITQLGPQNGHILLLWLRNSPPSALLRPTLTTDSAKIWRFSLDDCRRAGVKQDGLNSERVGHWDVLLLSVYK